MTAVAIDPTKLETAATDALSKLTKPSWASPTWWLGTLATIFGALVAAGVVGAGTPFAIGVGGALALGSVVASHWKDGMVKTAIAAAPELWHFVRGLHAAKTAAVLSQVRPAAASPSLEPTVYRKPVSELPGAMPQAVDPEDPRR